MLLDFLFTPSTKTRRRVRNTRLSVESLENRIVFSTLGLSTTSLEPGPGDPLIDEGVSKGVIISIDPAATEPGPGDPFKDESTAPAAGQIVDINPTDARPGPGDPLEDIDTEKPGPGDPLIGKGVRGVEPGPGDPLKDES